MKSRTSFFDKTLLRKNITRFAPLWGVYLLCLLTGLGLMYMNADNRLMNFWFASYVAQSIQVMSVVNLLYAPIVAMLIFGDLFNSRMCNALHAMPLRRETIFLTNVVSGLVFSLAPTAVMALVSLPLLAATVVHNAWLIGILWFLAANLQFACFFGMAVFCVFCTGNRLGFAALYALLNGGVFVVYGIVDLLYTPILYGVVTPTLLMKRLTPIYLMAESPVVEVESYHTVRELFEGRESEAVANFMVHENYYTLLVLALVGLVFLLLGLLLYRKRDLECAGDAVAFRWLAPVFQTAAALVGGMAAVLCLTIFNALDHEAIQYGMAVLGMAVGWFAGKMLLERTTRVFWIRNWMDLGVLTALFALSLTLTHFDVLGIETWLPRTDRVKSVTLFSNGNIELTEKQDIDRIIRLQQLALEDRLENSGAYPKAYVDSFGTHSRIPYPEFGFTYGDGEGMYPEDSPRYYADWITLQYKLENGRTVSRNYTVWADFEEGEIIKEYASRWEYVMNYNRRGFTEEPDYSQVVDMVVDGKRVPAELINEETVRSFLAAVREDCDARRMTQDSYYHEGRFKIPNLDGLAEEPYYYDRNLYVDITTRGEKEGEVSGIYLQVYPDCTSTVAWLQEHGLLTYEIVDGSYVG